MFKYTPPWQVLCHSLENDMKRQLTFAPSRDALGAGGQQPLSRSYPFPSPRQPPPPPAPPPPLCGPPAAVAMEPVSTPSMVSSPRKWNLKPLSPRLELSELRSMVSPSTPEHARPRHDNTHAERSLSPHASWDGQSQDSSALEGVSIGRAHSSVSVTTAAPGERGQDMAVVSSRQVAVGEASRDGEASWSAGGSSTPSTAPGTPTSSVGSHSGFYSFVDDPASPEAESNEEWMTSPERQAQLATLKRDHGYTLQTYALGHKPDKLFEESNGDARYRVDSSGVSRAVADEREVVKVDRKEIIREQAPRKSGAFKEQWSSLDMLDLPSAQQRLVDGFSICYGPANPAAEPTPAEPGTVDEQQIDFNSARQQFIMMERAGGSPVIRRAADTSAQPTAPTPSAHPPPPKTYTPHASLQSSASLNSPASPHSSTPQAPPQPYAAQEPGQVPAEMRRYMFAEGSGGGALDVVSKESRTSDDRAGRSQSLSSPLGSEDDVFVVSNAVTVRVTEGQDAVKQSGATELDSGLGDQMAEDASDRSSSSSSSSPAPDAPQETAAEREVRIARETPIEREIRVAQEREESLRRVRGIRHSSSVEMVEITSKPLLSLAPPTLPTLPALPAGHAKPKESSRVSFLIQREIARELQRTDASGGHKGALYDVEERRRVFEQPPQVPQVKPSPTPPVSVPTAAAPLDVSQSSPAAARDDGRPALTEISEQSGAEEEEGEEEGGGQPCCPHRHADHTALPVSRVTPAASSERSWGLRTRISFAPSTDHQRAPSPASGRSSTGAFFFSSSSRSSLSGAGQGGDARSAPAWKAHLERRDLEQERRDLEQHHLEQRDLEQHHLERRDLEQHHLERRDLEQTHLERRDLEQHHLERRDLEQEQRDLEQEQRDLEQHHLERRDLEQEQRDLEQEQRDLELRLQSAPEVIREDIERDLQREQEHQTQSRARAASLDTGLDHVDGSEQVVTMTTTTPKTQTDTTEPPKNTTCQPSGAETAAPPKEPVPPEEPVPVLPEEPVKPVSSRSSYSWSVDTHPTRRMASTDKALHTPSPRPYGRLPSISMVTAQPWGNQKPVSVAMARVPPLVLPPSGRLERLRSSDALAPPLTPTSPPRGLTHTLLEGFEEHRAKLKMEENAYAGIQPSDDVNHEVLEATRVTRHKNRMALRWEAGVYANEDDK
ncbi:uncharacterized protein misp isoform X2 [Sardina pilchardus]|uniref:uncharacterized protein misp isoform X2 n=1 Tax=Sardina pilchardus TaxID=27697 RepID=UPI002E0FF3A7